MSTSPQPSMTGASPLVSSISPAPVDSTFEAPAPACVADGTSAAGPWSAVVPFPSDLSADPSTGARVALVGRSSTFWFLPLPLYPVFVRSQYWPDHRLVIPKMLGRRIPLPFFVRWPSKSVGVTPFAVRLLLSGPSFIRSKTSMTSNV